MATILAHIRVKSGAEAEFERTARELHERSHTADRGLLRYEYWRGRQPGCYYCLLAFESYAAFLAHQSSPHHEAAAPALMTQIDQLTLEWLDPLQGASPLPATVPGRAPEGASDLARRYAEAMPAEIASWWLALRTRLRATEEPGT
jgi:quinol monooxygenase YgiN